MILSSTFASTFMYMFMLCEPGERVTNAFEKFNEELEQCNWHLLPPNLRRLYLIFVMDTQQPINIQCYGGILCTRETYKSVITSQLIFTSIYLYTKMNNSVEFPNTHFHLKIFFILFFQGN